MKNKQFMQRICNTFIFDNINFLQCTIGWFRRQADLEGRAFTVKGLSSYPPTLLASANPLHSPPSREGER